LQAAITMHTKGFVYILHYTNAEPYIVLCQTCVWTCVCRILRQCSHVSFFTIAKMACFRHQRHHLCLTVLILSMMIVWTLPWHFLAWWLRTLCTEFNTQENSETLWPSWSVLCLVFHQVTKFHIWYSGLQICCVVRITDVSLDKIISRICFALFISH